MKPIAIVALNLVIVVLALVAYDVLRGEPTAAPEARANGGEDVELAAFDGGELEERLRVLETDRRRVRRPDGTDPDVLARLEALESALPGDITVASDATSEPAPAAAFSSPWQSLDTPTAAEIKRFRQLQDAVRREEAIAKNKARIDAALDALPVNLTADERVGVHRAYAEFRPHVDEIWGAAKAEAQQTIAAGGQVDRAAFVADTTAVIQQEFATTLSAVVGAADAETIAGALMAAGK